MIKNIICIILILNTLLSYSQNITKLWELQKIEFTVSDSTIKFIENKLDLTWTNSTDSIYYKIKVYNGQYFNNPKEIINQLIDESGFSNLVVKAAPVNSFTCGGNFNCYYYKGTAVINTTKVAFNIYGFHDPYEFKNIAAMAISYNSNTELNYTKFIENSDKILTTIKKVK